MRVLVADDSAFMRRSITRMIESDPALEVIGTARDGREAIDKAVSLHPDVITLDIEMPEVDGLTAMRLIRLKCRDPKPAFLICSSLTTDGSHEALHAMRLGAADVIAKDAGTLGDSRDAMRDDLVRRIKAIGASTVARAAEGASSAHSTPSGMDFRLADPEQIRLIAIGSSTGGPPVLETILGALRPDLPVPIVIAQHMPPLFTRSLASRLDSLCALSVVHASGDLFPLPGTAYVIEGGKNGLVRAHPGGHLELTVTEDPMDKIYIPSADLLLDSAATLGTGCLGIVLTGMGEDGLAGGRHLREAAGQLIAQQAETCTVYGMPRAIVEAGLADAQLTPVEIAETLSDIREEVAPRRCSA